MGEPGDIDEFETHLETIGLDTGMLETRAAETMTLSGPDRVGDRPSLHSLPELQVAPETPTGDIPDLEIIDTLGEGGMGVVELARQVALDRKVAVKTAQTDTDHRLARELLAEALVTGQLEHPNIVPIHTVGCDPEGRPMIVMKRIRGTAWGGRLAEPEQKSREEWERDIEVLVDVARAAHFAHSRGVLHRDIKPSNVMVGEFGEVYLVDWGLAMDMEDVPDDPPADEEDFQVCGSPVYMAPEMATGQVQKFDARTDVYLLGATLHHVLTGRPRHQGETTLQTLYAAAESEPHDYPDHVPAEFADIANMACHRNQNRRFESAEAFGRALRDALDHRESVRIGASAAQRLDDLLELSAEADPDPGAVHDLYGECRFGFEQALEMWPNNDAARRGLRDCLEAMTDHHLDQQNLEAARGCIAELEDPPDELVERTDELAERLERQEREMDRLRDLKQDLDLSTSSAARSIIMVILGVLFTATTLYAAIQVDIDPPTYAEELRNHMLGGFVNLTFAGGAVLLFYKRISANRANRRLFYMLVGIFAILAMLRWGTWYLDESLLLARIAEKLVIALALFGIGLATDLRIASFSLFFVAGAAVAIAWPSLQIYANAAATAATFGAFAWIWRPGAN